MSQDTTLIGILCSVIDKKNPLFVFHSLHKTEFIFVEAEKFCYRQTIKPPAIL